MFYAHTRSHEPVNQGRRYWDEASTPLFSFGHGLSYGQFEYSELRVDNDIMTTADTATDGRRGAPCREQSVPLRDPSDPRPS